MSIRLAKKTEPCLNLDFWYKENYKQWKNNMDKNQVGANFFILYKDFEKYLRRISPGALKLYLFYGFSSNNETGVSWHGIDSISNYFGVSEKTINNWNKELINEGLIFRLNKDNKRNKITYLLPLSMTLITLTDLEICKSDSFKIVMGELKKVFHLYQWRQNEEDINKYDTPYHTSILVFEKAINEKDSKVTSIEYPLEKNTYDISKKISKNTFSSDILTFESDLCLNLDTNIKIQGIAVNSKFNLKKKKVIYELIQELTDKNTNLDHYEQVNLD